MSRIKPPSIAKERNRSFAMRFFALRSRIGSRQKFIDEYYKTTGEMITMNSVSNYEHGKSFPTAERLKRLCEFFGVDLSTFYPQTPEDAVLVVRCKDCIWYESVYLKRDGTVDKRYKPSVCVRGTYAILRKADWYCADGERREYEAD